MREYGTHRCTWRAVRPSRAASAARSAMKAVDEGFVFARTRSSGSVR